MGRKLLKIIWPRGKWRWPYRGALAMVVFTFASVEVTSQSWFCNSCHIMNSYYHSWQTGKHKDVDCVQCHIPPGITNYVSAKLNGLGQVVDDMLARTSSKPSASVSDFSCMRAGCHNPDDVRKLSKRTGKYFFDHAKHINVEYMGVETHCTTCHSHVQGNQHFELNTNACVSCHLLKATAPPPGATTLPTTLLASTTQPASAAGKTPPSACNQCHSAPDKPLEYQGLRIVHAEFTSYGAACESCHRGVTAVPEKMKDDQCFSCHDFGTEKLTDAVDMHKVHLQGRHKVECFSCHGVTRHGPSAQAMRLDQLDCRSCHLGQHAVQQLTYKTIGPAHVPSEGPAVTPMFLAHVDCTGCHVQPRALTVKSQSGASVAAAVPEACDRCHKPGLGKEMIPLWQKNTRALYDSVNKMLPPAATTMPATKAEQLIREARQYMDTVRLDGSWGVHNPRYTQKLIEDARNKLIEAGIPPTTRPTTQP